MGCLDATSCHCAAQSLLIYTYSFAVGPVALRWMLEPIVKLIFDWQTRRRFASLRDFLSKHADEVAQWQHNRSKGVLQQDL